MPFSVKDLGSVVTDPMGLNNSKNIVVTPDSHIHALYWRPSALYHAESSDAGQTWFEQEIDASVLNKGEPCMARDRRGNIYIAYLTGGADDYELKRAYKPFLGDWELLSNFEPYSGLDPAGTSHVSNPSIVVDSNEVANCFYSHERDGGNKAIVLGTWVGNADALVPTQIDDGPTFGTGLEPKNFPSCAVGDDGDLWCAWEQFRDTSQDWRLRVWTPFTPVNVSFIVDNHLRKPSITTSLNNTGIVTVQKVHKSTGLSQISLFEFQRVGGFMGRTIIVDLTSDSTDQIHSSLARDREGRIFIFWGGIPDGGSEKKIRFIVHSGVEFDDSSFSEINHFAAGEHVSVADSRFSTPSRGIHFLFSREPSNTVIMFGLTSIWGQNRSIVKVGNFPDYKKLFSLTDTPAVSLYNASESKDFPLDWIREDATAELFADLQVVRLNRKPIEAQFSLPLLGIDVEEGDKLSLSHHLLDGILNGDANLVNDFEVVSIVRDAVNHKVDIQCELRWDP